MDVRHLNKDPSEIRKGEQFVAYAGDLAVEVLGTRFNIKNRDNRVTVSLLDGRIALRNFKEGGKTRVLSPGDVVSDGKDGFRNSA